MSTITAPDVRIRHDEAVLFDAWFKTTSAGAGLMDDDLRLMTLRMAWEARQTLPVHVGGDLVAFDRVMGCAAILGLLAHYAMICSAGTSDEAKAAHKAAKVIYDQAVIGSRRAV